MKDKKIKRIPYGVANYELLVRQNSYYVDKTPFLPMLEEAGNYLFFIRPRCFGKSLFLSVMEAYYDVYYKDRFEEFFKGTWIYDHRGKIHPGFSKCLPGLEQSIHHPRGKRNEQRILRYLHGTLLARYEGIKYAYILEIKYTKSGASPGDATIQQLKSEAQEQLKNYSLDEKFKKNIEKTHLIKIVLIFSGHQLIDMADVL